MSKSSKKIQKNIKKNIEKRKEEYPLKNQIVTIAKWILAIIGAAILISAITFIAKKEYFIPSNEETIEYTEILAGQTFSRNEEEYYVAFYDFDGTENLDETIKSIPTSIKVYKVDLGNAMNKNVLGANSNKKVVEASDLQVNGTTLIKIVKGNNEYYLEGFDDIKSYLTDLK